MKNQTRQSGDILSTFATECPRQSAGYAANHSNNDQNTTTGRHSSHHGIGVQITADGANNQCRCLWCHWWWECKKSGTPCERYTREPGAGPNEGDEVEIP